MVIVALGGLLAKVWNPFLNRISDEQWLQLRDGMTIVEVQELLGRPSYTRDFDDGGAQWTYKDDHGQVILNIEDGRFTGFGPYR